MPDWLQSICPPDGWMEDEIVFRSTFLSQLTPKDAAAARRLGSLWYQLLLEAHCLAPQLTSSLQHRDISALAADLRFMQGYAHWMARDNELHGLEPSEARLSLLAGEIAPELRKLAEKAESALQ